MTAYDQTLAILTPWLGSIFGLNHTPLMERISFKMAHFHPEKDSLLSLAQDIDSQLFMAVRDVTKGRMVLHLDSGTLIKVRLQDFSVMADELLYPVMQKLPQNVNSFHLIRDYSMRQSSLSALRALALDFQAFQTEDELRTVLRMIKTCHPPFRWRAWLRA